MCWATAARSRSWRSAATKAWPAGDTFLLCSDGLWHFFTDAELGAVTSKNTPRQASEMLINKAGERAQGKGGNCTMAIVKLVKPPKEAAELHRAEDGPGGLSSSSADTRQDREFACAVAEARCTPLRTAYFPSASRALAFFFSSISRWRCSDSRLRFS